MSKVLKKYKTHIVCILCGLLIGFIMSYVAFSLCINVPTGDIQYIEKKEDIESVGKMKKDEEGVEGSDDADASYNELIDNYKVYLASRKVGDEVIFGNYEKDNNIYNGKEDIEWVVLYKSNKNSMMLMSKYVLDCMSYDLDKKTVVWQDSYMRKFLNTDFYDTAFNDIYKLFIMENDMTNNQNVNYKTDAGPETKDKVFLLSESQAKKYFSKNEKDGSNISRTARPTEYAKEKGVTTIVDKNVWYDGNCSYYLRTPGVDQSRVEVVEPSGAIYEYGELVTSTEVGIRPCIWVKY